MKSGKSSRKKWNKSNKINQNINLKISFKQFFPFESHNNNNARVNPFFLRSDNSTFPLFQLSAPHYNEIVLILFEWRNVNRRERERGLED